MPGRVLPEEALKWYAALDVFAEFPASVRK